MEDILIEHQVGSEFLDLGEQNILGLCIELGA